MPALRRLLLTVVPPDVPVAEPEGSAASWAGEPGPGCAFCAARSGPWQLRVPVEALGIATASEAGTTSVDCCPLCALSAALNRPRIDEEASLVWLPEMSQAAINTLMREVHRQLRAAGEGLRADDVIAIQTEDRAIPRRARTILASRGTAAIRQLGTDRPSDLASALIRLRPSHRAHRATLLAGIRLLPSGRFFVRGRDVYPDIVDAWSRIALAPAPHPAPDAKPQPAAA